jgi:hypothetical protein
MITDTKAVEEAVKTSTTIDELVIKLGGNPDKRSDRSNLIRVAKKKGISTKHIIGRRKLSFLGISEETIKNSIEKSKSLAGTLANLGLTIYGGGNYQTLKKYISEHSIDISHFTGKAWNKGKKLPPKRPLEDYFSNEHKIGSNNLRKRLLTEKIFEHICSSCLQTEWLGKPIPLELHHIDENHMNNSLENLTILCPNCHAIIPMRHKKQKQLEKLEENKNKHIQNKLEKIKKQHIKKDRPQKIIWPTNEVLSKLVWEKPVSILCKNLGVSDKAIAKHCSKRNIATPPRGYWAKLYAKKIDNITT